MSKVPQQTILYFFAAVSFAQPVRTQPSYLDKYADVLRHYSHRDADSLKYRAALFLINNMDGHMSPEGPAIEDYVCHIKTMKKARGIRELQAAWLAASKVDPVDYRPDSAIVSGSFLISNIESAFDAWGRAAWRDEVSFIQFCRYVLPYRVSDEHIGGLWRDSLYRRYGSLVEGMADMKRAFAAIKDSVFKEVPLSNDYCPYTLDPLACLSAGRAECGQRCALLVAVLRALGIPASIDMTPMWADYSNKSHAWVSIVAGNGCTYTVHEQDTVARRLNPIDASQFQPRYGILPEDSCPYTVKTSKTPVKVYRAVYERCSVANGISRGVLASPFVSDVSEWYGLDVDVTLEAESGGPVFLCAYLSGAEWTPVATALSSGGHVTFRNVGTGVVCVAATIREGRQVFLTKPFLTGKNGVERFFMPSATVKDMVRINRKYPLCSYITDTWGFMKGATFEASDDGNFSNVDTLAVVKTMPFGMTTLRLLPTRAYRFLRYHAPPNNRSSLAELQFYTMDEEGRELLLTGAHFSTGIDTTRQESVFDGNPATAGKALQVGYTIGVDLGSGNERAVTKIVFAPSTDLNFVERGHLYELHYFDTDWHLVGRVYSKGDSLEFDGVPRGALLLLKDRSGGVEERIFEYVDGRQVWH